jgi:hypothetical protein
MMKAGEHGTYVNEAARMMKAYKLSTCEHEPCSSEAARMLKDDQLCTC